MSSDTHHSGISGLGGEVLEHTEVKGQSLLSMRKMFSRLSSFGRDGLSPKCNHEDAADRQS